MNYTEVFISNVRKIIKQKGLKQCAVAVRVGLTANTFSAMLNERKIITAEHVPRIANALEVSIDDLFAK